MLKIIICIIAGLGAGVGTGFAGMSAAVVVAPMLITFLDVPAYEAIGIALASDVLASAASAATYAKNKNLDVRNGLLMMLFVLLFTVVGSWCSSFLPDTTIGSFSLGFMILLGVKFLVKPIMTTKESFESKDKKKRIVLSIVFGSLVGFLCGFVGAGGGMMMLFVLTSALGYELKTAVGTSVFIMAFTALTGATSHFVIGGMPDWVCLVVCVISTLIFALISAKIANKSNPKILNRTVGGVLLATGIGMLLFEIL